MGDGNKKIVSSLQIPMGNVNEKKNRKCATFKIHIYRYLVDELLVMCKMKVERVNLTLLWLQTVR